MANGSRFYCALHDGWRWLVILGSFLCLFVVEGLCLCYGLYMYEMITDDYFNAISINLTATRLGPSLAILSLPGALLCSACTLMGPLAGALVNCFGYRLVAGVGAVFAATGLFLSSFSRSSVWFTILFGVVGGIGFGLIYLPAITVVGDWFEHRRAFIVGLALCGGGVGAGVLAPIISPLSQTFTWRGTVILTSALLFQILLGIALFRPLYTHEFIQLMQQQRREERRQHQKSKHHTASKFHSHHALRVQRGSIMARIIEEKSRQRTTSTGSLDGMVITRENKLVALSSPEAYEAARAAAAVYAAQLRQQPDQTQQSAEGSKNNETSVQPYSGVVEKRSTCSQTNTTRALQTLPEGVVLASNTSHGTELHVAVIPPPVHFNRVAIRRIALAVVRKLQANQLMTSCLTDKQSVGVDTRTPPSLCPSRVESWAGFVERRPRGERDNTLYSSLDAGDNQWKISLQPDAYHSLPPEQASLKLMGRSSRSLSQHTSLMSLDSAAALFITHEVNSLPLDESTKLAIQIAIRAELSRPKYRADFFHPGTHRLSSSGHTFNVRIEKPYSPPTSSVEDPTFVAFVGDQPPSDSVRQVKFSSSVHTPQPHTTDQRLNDFRPNLIANESASNWSEICAYLRAMLDPEPLTSTTFQVLLAACSLQIVVFWVPYHYMPLLLQFAGAECSRNRIWCPEGLPQQADLKLNWLNQLVRMTTKNADGPFPFFLSPGSVLSTIGFSNIIGRIVASLYIERGSTASSKAFGCCPRLKNPLVLNNISLLLCALALCCYPLSIHGLSNKHSHPGGSGISGENSVAPTQSLSMSFRVFLVYAASVVYGAAGATALSLRSVTLVELFGIRRLTNVFGYLLIFQGLAVICGLPLFGYFCDSSCYHLLQSSSESSAPTLLEPIASELGWCARRLNLAFYLCASLFVVTILLFLPLRWLSIRDACCWRKGPAVSDRWTLRIPMQDELIDQAFESPAPSNEQNDPQQTQTTQVLSPT